MEQRGTGKTTRLIVEGVKQCLDNPGQWFEMRDHIEDTCQHDYVANGVSQVLVVLHVNHERVYNFIKVTPQ